METEIVAYGVGALIAYMLIKDLVTPGFMFLLKKKPELGIYAGEQGKAISENAGRLVLLENKFHEFQNNHTVHQERIEKALYKIGVHLQIKDLFD